VANVRKMLGTVLMDVLLILPPFVLNLFPFPLTPAQFLGNGLLIKGWSANMTLALTNHKYNCAANHVAPLQYCC
jgi:hypothetical protein